MQELHARVRIHFRTMETNKVVALLLVVVVKKKKKKTLKFNYFYEMKNSIIETK